MNLHNMKQPSETLLVTLVQANLHWEDKDANLSMFDKMIRSAESKMEVVVLPEMFNTGFSMEPKKLAERMDGPSVAWMKKIAADLKIILVGSVIIEEDGKYYTGSSGCCLQEKRVTTIKGICLRTVAKTINSAAATNG